MDAKDNVTALDADWLVPSEQYGWWSVAKNILPFLLLCTALPYLADHSLMWAWACCPLVGFLIYRVSLVMHDCGHQTLFKNRKLNQRIGLLLGAMIGVDFHTYRNEHHLHHQNYGTQNDPQGHHYRGLNKMGPLRLRWHIIKSLLGFNLVHTMNATIIAPQNLKRLFQNGDILLVVLAQLALFIAVTDMGRHLSLALIPMLSSATFGLLLTQLRNMAEHGAYGDTREVGNVRSHSGSWLSGLLPHDLNFRYHLEHHLYPDYPSVHLPAIHHATQTEASDSAYIDHAVEQPSSIFSTLSAIISAAHAKQS